MYRFVILSEDEYQSFQEKHEYANFLNSLEAAKLRMHEGWKVEYVGVKEDNQVVAATILASIPMMKIFRYYNAQRGFLLDYHNEELLIFFTKELITFLKKKKALYLLCNPRIVYEEYSNEGKPISIRKDYILENMKKAGFHHEGFDNQFRANSEVLWEYSLFIKERNEEMLLEHFSARTRYCINKSFKQKVKIRTLGKDEMDTFFRIFKDTADRKGFENLLRKDEHYINMMDYYGDHIRIYYAYLSAKETLQSTIQDKLDIEQKIISIQKSIDEKGPQKRFLNQKKELEFEFNAKDSIIHEMEELVADYGEIIPLSTAMFIDYPYEMVYMYSGSIADKRLRKFEGSSAIQWESIKHAIEHKIDHYNFSGISGNFEKDSVFEYKKGFNGVAEKLIGEFTLPIHKMAYRIYKILKK